MIVERDLCGRIDVHDPHTWAGYSPGSKGREHNCPGRHPFSGDGFEADFIGHCCRCDHPIKVGQRVMAHGRGYIHLDCAQGSER